MKDVKGPQGAQGLNDAQAMDRIAAMLGSNAEWRSPADYLEAIANLVEKTGRPHPGDQDDDTLRMYRRAADRYGYDHDGDEDEDEDDNGR